MKKLLFFFILAISIIFVSNINAQYQLQQVFTTTTFVSPLEMADPRDGTNRVFVVGQKGIIYVLDLNNPSNPAKIFLDVSDRVTQGGLEPGLLGLAFHPDYENNKYFYIHYTTTSPIRNIVARYSVSPANPDSALKNSEVIVLSDTLATIGSHFGGKIDFGPDNYLYISLGMGTAQNDPPNNAQNLALLRGKLLRINVDSIQAGLNYSIPAANPFKDSTGSQRKEIFAWGFRNMWKFNFDDAGRIWGADVGQGSREEIDIIQRGKNYGWRIMEGTLCFNPNPCDTTGLVKPIFEYSHSVGNSITGGYVSTSPLLPSLINKYLYSDWANGKIWALTYDGINPATSELVTTGSAIGSFGMDKNKNIYVCSVSGNKVYKLVDLTVNIEPFNGSAPAGYSLYQNYPNPFNPSTVIKFDVAGEGYTSLNIYDMQGKEVAQLVGTNLKQGSYSVSWKPGNVPSGVYFYRLSVNGNVFTKKLVFAK